LKNGFRLDRHAVLDISQTVTLEQRNAALDE
jgi:hypothetical protein